MMLQEKVGLLQLVAFFCMTESFDKNFLLQNTDHAPILRGEWNLYLKYKKKNPKQKIGLENEIWSARWGVESRKQIS